MHCSLMPKYDERCTACGHTEERTRRSTEEPDACSTCGGVTKVVWLQASRGIDKAKDPYDLLDGRIPASKKVRSFTGKARSRHLRPKL